MQWKVWDFWYLAVVYFLWLLILVDVCCYLVTYACEGDIEAQQNDLHRVKLHFYSVYPPIFAYVSIKCKACIFSDSIVCLSSITCGRIGLEDMILEYSCGMQ